MNHLKNFEKFGVTENDASTEPEVQELSAEEITEMENEGEDLEEAADPMAVTSKDTMRIQDIVLKAKGSTWKMKSLAEVMCKAIKDRFKALRRARAAERESQYELADIFFKRATELA